MSCDVHYDDDVAVVAAAAAIVAAVAVVAAVDDEDDDDDDDDVDDETRNEAQSAEQNLIRLITAWLVSWRQQKYPEKLPKDSFCYSPMVLPLQHY